MIKFFCTFPLRNNHILQSSLCAANHAVYFGLYFQLLCGKLRKNSKLLTQIYVQFEPRIFTNRGCSYRGFQL